MPNIANIKEHLRREGRLQKEHIHKIVDLAYEIFCAEENVLTVPAPVTGTPTPLYGEQASPSSLR